MPSPPASSAHDPDARHDRAVRGIRFRGGSGYLGDWTSELEPDFDSILDVRRDGERTE